jgi:hypothetical protein
MLLCVKVERKKLPTYTSIVLKRKTPPKINVKGIRVQAQESGRMNQSHIMDWIKRLWKRRPGALITLNRMLVLDNVQMHTTDQEKLMLTNGKTDIAIIPGGLTSLLQPLDVCTNRPFKPTLKEMYPSLMADGKHGHKPTENQAAGH